MHTHNIRVYYEDTDLAGIVYYANYLKYLERGRSEAVRAAGIDQRAMREGAGLVFVVRRLEIDYHAPARFDDVVTVTTATVEVGHASLVMHQRVLLLERLLVDAQVKMATVTLAGRVARFPDPVRAGLDRLRAGS